MVLIDTSAWIEFFNKKNNKISNKIEEIIKIDFNIYITHTILQEILQGIKEEKKYTEIKNSLLEYRILPFNFIDDSIGAANLYRRIRSKGITIKKSNDCLIAYQAIKFDIPILHLDRDFDNISNIPA